MFAKFSSTRYILILFLALTTSQWLGLSLHQPDFYAPGRPSTVNNYAAYLPLLLQVMNIQVQSSHVRRRNVTLINLLVVTTLCSVPPALLFYWGDILNSTPPFGICFTQAILKHGSDPMFVVASLALVIEFVQGTGILVIKFVSKRRVSTVLLLALPYITFAIFAALTAILGATHPHKVKHKSNQIYCTVDFKPLTHGVEIFSVVVVVITVSLEIYTIAKFRRNWQDIRNDGRPPSKFGVSQALRIAGFTILQLNYLILCAVDFYFASVATHIIPIIYEALMPLATFLIFGTTQDCLQAWTCCGRRKVPNTSTINGRASKGDPGTPCPFFPPRKSVVFINDVKLEKPLPSLPGDLEYAKPLPCLPILQERSSMPASPVSVVNAESPTYHLAFPPSSFQTSSRRMPRTAVTSLDCHRSHKSLVHSLFQLSPGENRAITIPCRFSLPVARNVASERDSEPRAHTI
ncbi:hypothetical protein ABKN59_002732 [Abortiporus biennis]